jgi:prepilin-type N-terminal cleavage/methylation domain-containing protein
LAQFQSSQRLARPLARRRGFTLIEIVTVVAIIAVLEALTVIGLKHLSRSNRDRDTQTVLQAAEAMVAELQASGGTSRLNAAIAAQVTAGNYRTIGNLIAVRAPGLVDVNAPGANADRDPTQAPTFTNAAIVATYAPNTSTSPPSIMSVLLSNPNNKAMFDALPQARKQTYTGPNGTTTMLLDGYGNPIIFVPAAGIVYVKVNGQFLPPTNGQDTPIQAIPPRPFWASAGQDGDFSNGDDNLYSFTK